MDLAGRVALVTGGSTGIGRAVSFALAEHGVAVVVNYNSSESAARDVAQTIVANGGRALALKADVSVEHEVKAMVAAASMALGPIDLLVNNAAAPQYLVELSDLDSVDDAVWDRMFAVNVKGMFYCARAVAPAMRARGAGAIVNIASIAALTGDGSSLPYAVSKAAVVGLTRSLARALAPEVRVWCVAPGLVKTRRTVGYEDGLARFAAQTLLGQTASPDDVAAMVRALLSQDGATGGTIVVDGGGVFTG